MKDDRLTRRWPVGGGVLGISVLVTFIVGGCATDRPFIWARDLPAVAVEPEAVVHARDTIVVQVQDQAPLSGEFVVREDGGYLHPTLGNVFVEGKTPVQVAELVQIRLTNVIVNPRVMVSITRKAPARVNVVGEVKAPGPYELTRDRSVTAALAAAGWLTPFASSDRIFVVRAGEREVRLRFKEQELTSPEPRIAPFRLRDGDVVVAE
jgi:polysaccharide export outer membrane protein